MRESATVELTARGILLDIEGTTSSIAFVHEVMFPFVRAQLASFLAENFAREDVRAACEQIAYDAGHASLDEWSRGSEISTQRLIDAEVHRLMDSDVKATGLKSLQGLIWAAGFHDGQLRAHVYPDVIPQIQSWRARGIDVRIYSSGSIAAQKLFFGHVAGSGDCLPLFSGHYDTTLGPKKEASSYHRLAADWCLAPAAIVFVSDVASELSAAASAGLQVVASVRPGNAPLDTDELYPRVSSFSQIFVNPL